MIVLSKFIKLNYFKTILLKKVYFYAEKYKFLFYLHKVFIIVYY